MNDECDMEETGRGLFKVLFLDLTSLIKQLSASVFFVRKQIRNWLSQMGTSALSEITRPLQLTVRNNSMISLDVK